MSFLQSHHLRFRVSIVRAIRSHPSSVAMLAATAMLLCLAPLPSAEAGNSRKKTQQQSSGSGSYPAGNTAEARQPGVVRIVSPDTEQTFSYFEIVAQRIWWSRAQQQLSAEITFSNINYTGRGVRREDEPFSFRFPGAVLDPATQIVTARAPNGNRVVVGRFVNDLVGKSFRFAPASFVVIYNNHGKVAVELIADNRGVPVDLHWQVRGRELRWRNLLD